MLIYLHLSYVDICVGLQSVNIVRCWYALLTYQPLKLVVMKISLYLALNMLNVCDH